MRKKEQENSAAGVDLRRGGCKKESKKLLIEARKLRNFKKER